MPSQSPVFPNKLPRVKSGHSKNSPKGIAGQLSERWQFHSRTVFLFCTSREFEPNKWVDFISRRGQRNTKQSETQPQLFLLSGVLGIQTVAKAFVTVSCRRHVVQSEEPSCHYPLFHANIFGVVPIQAVVSQINIVQEASNRLLRVQKASSPVLWRRSLHDCDEYTN